MTENNLELVYINTQDDYFEHQLFEKYWDGGDDRAHLVKQLKVQLLIMAVAAALIVFVPFVDKSFLYLVLAFVGIFLFRFVYEYKWGYNSDYQNLLKLYENLKKKKVVNVYDEKITLDVSDTEINLRTDAYRRFFEWQDFDYIQETNNLIIMHVKLSNKPNLQDFEAIKVSKRYIFPEKIEQLREIIERKRKEYDIGVLTDDETNPYISEVISK